MTEGVEKENYKRDMTDGEKLANARDFRDGLHTNITIAERRTAELSDEFARLELQIATILFAFATLFLGQFRDGSGVASRVVSTLATSTVPTISSDGLMIMKLSFAFALACLIASLVFGMIQIKSKEAFWGEMLAQRIMRFRKWHETTKRKVTFEEAEAYYDGTSLDKGIIRDTPAWPWRLQTIFLSFAIAIFYALALVFLFT